jgi:hypothetical protein
MILSPELDVSRFQFKVSSFIRMMYFEVSRKHGSSFHDF